MLRALGDWETGTGVGGEGGRAGKGEGVSLLYSIVAEASVNPKPFRLRPEPGPETRQTEKGERHNRGSNPERNEV